VSEEWPYQPYVIVRCPKCRAERMTRWAGTGRYTMACRKCGRQEESVDGEHDCPDGCLMVCGEGPCA